MSRLFGLFSLACLAVLASSDAMAQPRGTYMRTCRGIAFDGERLVASCLDPYGRWNRTALSLRGCQGDISNEAGQLSCERGYGGGWRSRGGYGYDGGYDGPPRRRGGMPGGTWLESCRPMGQEGPRVLALCRDGFGNMRQTSADVRSCGSLANRNGRLVCE